MIERWQAAQDHDLERYHNDGPLGVFSCEQLVVPRIIGEIMAGYIGGRACLDVGSGLLHRPAYMDDRVRFVGVDPYQGTRRGFPFAQAFAESLPFPSGTFDGVSMMSVIDHFLSAGTGIDEARRVLVSSGYLFVWITPRGFDDGHHVQSFTLKTLVELVSGRGFSVVETRKLQEPRPEFPPMDLLVASKE